jgi:hypothetical protein
MFLVGSFEFHSWMVEESMGFPLFLLALLCAVAFLRGNGTRWAVLFLISIFTLTLTHHLSSFMVILVLLLLSGIALTSRRGLFGCGRSVNRKLHIMLAISVVLWVSFAAIIGEDVFKTVVSAVVSIVNPTSTARDLVAYSAIWNDRTMSVFVLTLIVGGFLVARIIANMRNRKALLPDWNMTVLLWPGTLVVLVFSFTKIFKSAFIPNYARMLTFPWAFLFLAGFEVPRKRGEQWLALCICTLFLLLNPLSIHPYVYGDGYRLVTGEQDLRNSQGLFDTLDSFPMKGVVACDGTAVQIVTGWYGIRSVTMPPLLDSSQAVNAGIDYVLIRAENLRDPLFPTSFPVSKDAIR